jgi:hypothetical protein
MRGLTPCDGVPAPIFQQITINATPVVLALSVLVFENGKAREPAIVPVSTVTSHLDQTPTRS